MNNLATILALLYKLLQKNTGWLWDQLEQKFAFEEIKEQLLIHYYVVHYDPNAKLISTHTASPYGVGAVFLHQFNDGGTYRALLCPPRQGNLSNNYWTETLQSEKTFCDLFRS